jgi:hypothetical protein
MPDPKSSPLPFPLSEKALTLILDAEGTKMGWPGGASGVTLPYGYDLGYHTLGQFAEWRPFLSVNDFAILRALIGVTGTTARDRARVLTGVTVPLAAAKWVFLHNEMPRAERSTEAVFPGVEKLPTDAAGALVSLVFNRGTRLTDNDPLICERREMRAIRDAVPLGDLMEIAVNLRSMCRLWTGMLHHPYDVRMSGLIQRRGAEASLVESCIEGGTPLHNIAPHQSPVLTLVSASA